MEKIKYEAPGERVNHKIGMTCNMTEVYVTEYNLKYNFPISSFADKLKAYFS